MGISYSASGSSYITLGDTMVKACVNVPRPCGKRLLQEVGILSIEVRYSKPHIPSSSDADLRHVLTELFERHVILSRYPRQLIEAWVTIEEDAGGLFGACVTALSLAFADCGIQMLDILAATSVVGIRYIVYMAQFAYELDGILTVAVDLSSEVCLLATLGILLILYPNEYYMEYTHYTNSTYTYSKWRLTRPRTPG
eukprot:XP_001612301.1 hypothetical protein [Babesia bovis T2Bo]